MALLQPRLQITGLSGLLAQWLEAASNGFLMPDARFPMPG
jgi:hypothetical protein